MNKTGMLKRKRSFLLPPHFVATNLSHRSPYQPVPSWQMSLGWGTPSGKTLGSGQALSAVELICMTA